MYEICHHIKYLVQLIIPVLPVSMLPERPEFSQVPHDFRQVSRTRPGCSEHPVSLHGMSH